MFQIKIWAQMFFDDGSVSEGIRIPAIWLEKENESYIHDVAWRLLRGLNRTEGHLLIWGAGNMVFMKYPTSFSVESSFWALVKKFFLSLLHKIQ